MQKIQNSALHIVLQADKRTHIKDMHQELCLIFLSDRRKMHTLNQVYKCVYQLAPQNVASLVSLVSEHHSVNTRASTSLKLHVPDICLNICRRAFKYRGLQLWNIVDDEITAKTSLDTFKQAMKDSDMFQVV